MTILLSPDRIKAIVSEPSKLKPTASADDYLMERYQRVAREQALEMAECYDLCPQEIIENCNDIEDCRECWLAHLEREAQ